MKPWRLLLGAITLLVVGTILFVVNGFVGNPVSRALADSAADKYIRANYAHLNLEAKPAVYNFKTGAYMVVVQSKDSADTHFAINCRANGKVSGDSYENDVLSGWNTFLRISKQYSDFVEPLIESGFSSEIDILIADLVKPQDLSPGILPLDMDFDVHDSPLDAQITAYVYADSLSWENVAKAARELDGIMREHNLPVAEYTVVLELNSDTEKPRQLLGVYDFPAELLEAANLPQVMQEHFTAWEKNGLR